MGKHGRDINLQGMPKEFTGRGKPRGHSMRVIIKGSIAAAEARAQLYGLKLREPEQLREYVTAWVLVDEKALGLGQWLMDSHNLLNGDIVSVREEAGKIVTNEREKRIASGRLAARIEELAE